MMVSATCCPCVQDASLRPPHIHWLRYKVHYVSYKVPLQAVPEKEDDSDLRTETYDALSDNSIPLKNIYRTMSRSQNPSL